MTVRTVRRLSPVVFGPAFEHVPRAHLSDERLGFLRFLPQLKDGAVALLEHVLKLRASSALPCQSTLFEDNEIG
jgi:hypothetical protein